MNMRKPFGFNAGVCEAGFFQAFWCSKESINSNRKVGPINRSAGGRAFFPRTSVDRAAKVLR